MDSHIRLRHSPNATFQIVANEAILIHLKTGVYYSLNEVGTSFWNLLDGQRTLAECASVLAQEYNAPADVIQNDLQDIANDLVREGLAEVFN